MKTTTDSHTGVSLHQADEYIEATFDIGEGRSFSDCVTSLWDVRRRFDACSKGSKMAQECAQLHVARRSSRYDKQELRTRPGAGARRAWVIEAATVKKTAPIWYDLARVRKPLFKIDAPRSTPLPQLGLVIGRDANLRELFSLMTKIKNTRADLKVEEAALKARLSHIAEAIEWDGFRRQFTGGWAAQLAVLQFDSKELMKIAPDVAEKCTVEKFYPAKPPYIALVDVTVDPEAELDEIDGD